jgi:hypothetical protein
MSSIARLLDKLRRDQSQSCAATDSEAREPPLAFGEILAAAAYLDLGALPLESWPGYRDASRADNQDQCR